MIPDDMQDLLRQRNNAIVAIQRPNGGPQLNPVWYWWDGEAFYFRIGKGTAKYRNLQRSSSISLIVNDLEAYRYITVYGEAQIMETNPYDIAALIVEKYYAPDLAPQRMPSPDESDVVTVKLIPDKVVAIFETIAEEAAKSWLKESRPSSITE